MKDFLIRDYIPGDFKQVNNIWDLTGMGGALRGDDQSVVENTIQHGGKLLVLEHTPSGKVIGTSWMTHDYRRIYMHHFGIHPDFQRQGLGKILAEACLKFAKENNMQIKLEVHKENIGAIELYKKIGFNYLGDYLVYIIRDLKSIH